MRELAPYSQPPPVIPWLASILAGMDLAPQSSVGLLVALNQRVNGLIRYVTRLEPGVQNPAVTIETASGSCRDVAWLMVQAARALGFAARFVSGYLVQLVDAAAPIAGLVDDRADLHAWAEMFLPGAGWIGFDVTSGLIAGAGHIALAAAAHPESAAPVDGTEFGGDRDAGYGDERHPALTAASKIGASVLLSGMMGEAISGGEAIVASLLANGVDTVFGLPGAQLYPLFDALHRHADRITTIGARHEQACGYMAFGYARSTGRPGVFAVVPGPGVLNASAALCTAWGATAPVLCLTGQVPSQFIGRGRGHLHELPDQLGTLRTLVKWAARIERPEDAPAR